MKKLHIDIYTASRDMYGNCYSFAIVRNLRNDKSFATRANSRGNLEGIIGQAFGCYAREVAIVTEQVLPIREYNRLEKHHAPEHYTAPHSLDQCHYGPDWKKAFNSIGIRPKAKV
jgi:hypothetical protein